MEELKAQYQIFVDEYLTHFNARKAAIKAGYDAKWADNTGYVILNRPEVKREIDKVLAQRREVNRIESTQLIDQLMRIAFADYKDYVTWNDDGTSFIDPSKVDGEVIAELYVDTKKTIDSEGKESENVKRRLKLQDKVKAIELLGKYLGLFNDKVDHSGKVQVTIIDDIGVPKNDETK